MRLLQIKRYLSFIPLIDGVYVDACCRDGKSGLGIVAVKDNRMVEAIYIPTAKCPINDRLELQAIRWAKVIYPNQMVYSDNLWAVERYNSLTPEQVTWIPNDFNGLAHMLAYGHPAMLDDRITGKKTFTEGQLSIKYGVEIPPLDIPQRWKNKLK